MPRTMPISATSTAIILGVVILAGAPRPVMAGLVPRLGSESWRLVGGFDAERAHRPPFHGRSFSPPECIAAGSAVGASAMDSHREDLK